MVVGVLGISGNDISALSAALACLVAAWALVTQRTHNRLSVRPLPEIVYRDMEGEIEIKLTNHGVGPLIIETFAISRSGRLVGGALIDLMPELDDHWEFFVANIDGRSIGAGSSIVLLRYGSKKKRKVDPNIVAIRCALRSLKVHISYYDVYKNNLPVYIRCLSWFGRHVTHVSDQLS